MLEDKGLGRRLHLGTPRFRPMWWSWSTSEQGGTLVVRVHFGRVFSETTPTSRTRSDWE